MKSIWLKESFIIIELSTVFRPEMLKTVDQSSHTHTHTQSREGPRREDSSRPNILPPSPLIWERNPLILYLYLEVKLEASGECSISADLHGNRSNREGGGVGTLPL